jgi:hypothetical protein
MATVVKVKTTPFDAVIGRANATLAGLTPKANRAAAAGAATARLAPQIASENASSAAAQRQYAEQFTRSSEFAKAMAALRGQTAGMATAPFVDTAGSLSAIARGINGASAAASQAAHDQAAQEVAQSAGVGQVGGYDVPGMAATNQLTGVDLPARTMEAAAMGAAGTARNATDVTADQLGVIANQFNQQADDALATHQANLAQIRAQRPGIFEQALNDANARHDQALATIASLTGNKASYLQTAASQLAQRRQAAADLAERKAEFATTSANQERQTDITAGYFHQAGLTGDVNRRTAIAGLTGYDPKTGKLAAGFMLDPKTGNPINASVYLKQLTAQEKANQATRFGGLTPTSYAALKSKVTAQAKKMYAGVIGADRYDPKTRTFVPDPTKPGTPPVDYRTALYQLAIQGPPTADWAHYVVNLLSTIYKPTLGRNLTGPDGTPLRPASKADLEAAVPTVLAAAAAAKVAGTQLGSFSGGAL